MDRVSPGQKISIRAEDWNAMLSAAQAEKNRLASASGSALMAGLDIGSLLAVNHSGATLEPGEPAVLAGFQAKPDTLVDLPRCSLSTHAPQPDDTGSLAVALDSIPSGKTGRFRVMGQALVRLAVPPAEGEDYVAFDSDGQLAPALRGQARLLAYSGGIALILLGAANLGEPPRHGMFELLALPGVGSEQPPYLRICDGSNPDSLCAGVATINAQAYSCPAAEFDLSAQTQFFYLKFTPPKIIAGEISDSLCELIAATDEQTIVSTDSVFYYLIGHAWLQEREGRLYPRIAQDHPPGNLFASWQGPCIALLEGVVEDA